MKMTSRSACMISLSSVARMVESGGASLECSRAKASSPSVGRHLRRAAMHAVQKRVGSLSMASRESQATHCSCLLTHAESRVVFPLPAEAETRVSGCVQIASRSLSRRGRSTRKLGTRGGTSLVESSGIDSADTGRTGSRARVGEGDQLPSDLACSSKESHENKIHRKGQM